MHIFIRFSALYFLFGMVVTALLRPNALGVLGDMVVSFPQMMTLFLQSGWWVALMFAAMFAFVPARILLPRVSRAILVLAMSSLFFLTFTVIKTTLPFIVPFWADPLMARLDNALHFGTDPWQISHEVLAFLPAQWLQIYYVGLWLVPAMYFPVLLTLFDGDRDRVRRYVILYIWAWVGIGTVFALLFMSGGPVFYDRMMGGERFSGLLAALSSSGISQSVVGLAQSELWATHLSGSQRLGSGISAFPSVHVAVATVIALYVAERFRAALPLMIALVAAYQVLSVHLGWHYAIDGYFSILTVLALRAWLVRRDGAESRDSAPGRDAGLWVGPGSDSQA